MVLKAAAVGAVLAASCSVALATPRFLQHDHDHAHDHDHDLEICACAAAEP